MLNRLFCPDVSTPTRSKKIKRVGRVGAALSYIHSPSICLVAALQPVEVSLMYGVLYTGKTPAAAPGQRDWYQPGTVSPVREWNLELKGPAQSREKFSVPRRPNDSGWVVRCSKKKKKT
ncbi:hypothetical protein HYFRA_00013235 [Hymenoscyphus fraxineus]|uniref:Uncharacterized protein n=1 Tax=Hymenoscyphus fraxineus TaxID=746836 RepID=A0A9N9L9K7_9HELO|nr:hypothetical protein HYFRA_00013235 [Hymenoscyphus fraxineus]